MYVKIMKGDITTLEVDAIVNAANTTLMGGQGVDGAIHRRAGPRLLDECIRMRKEQFVDGLPVGEAIITPAFDLPAKHIIHTVGPKYSQDKDQADLLTNCFIRCLDLAEVNEVYTIAFPAISTGAYGYPADEVAKIAKKVFDHYEFDKVKEVIICLYTDDILKVFQEEFGI